MKKRPIVNRYAEAFDVCGLSLRQSPNLSFELRSKKSLAVATQLSGTGKTILGRNIISVLNRPREESSLEDEVAECLLKSQLLSVMHVKVTNAILARARARPENETLVTRVLREYVLEMNMFDEPSVVESLVDGLKKARTIFIDCSSLNSNCRNLQVAIIDSIAKNLGIPVQYNMFEYLSETYPNGIVLVLDEIGSLGDLEFEHWFQHQVGTSLEIKAMRGLSSIAQRILKMPNLYLYCTGRSEVVALQALSGSGSPLFPFSILLHPLSANDIETIITLNGVRDITSTNELLRYLCHQLSVLSGGIGRVIEYALRALFDMKKCEKAWTSKVAIDEALKNARKSFPKDFLLSANLPAQVMGSQLLDEIADLIREGDKNSFAENKTIKIGQKEIPFRDALNLVGFSFAPVLEDKDRLTLVAGIWQVDALPESARNKLGAFIVHFTQMFPHVAPTSRGQMFETLSICYMRMRCGQSSGKLFGDVFPHLAQTSANRIPVQPLTGFVIPKVVKTLKQEFTVAMKSSFMTRRGSALCFKNVPTMSPEDFSWLLASWLPEYSLAVPGGQSESQDWFVKLPGNVILGFSNQMRNEKSPLSYVLIDDEVGNIPVFTGCGVENVDYSMVVYALNLHNSLMEKCENKPSIILDIPTSKEQPPSKRKETIGLKDSGSSPTDCSPLTEPLSALTTQKVVVVNPVNEDGLSSFLTPEVAQLLQEYPCADSPQNYETMTRCYLALSFK